MPTPPRQVLIVGTLIAVVVVLVSGQIVKHAWVHQASLLEPWQRALAAKALASSGGIEANAQHELIHLQAEVATLRERLAEYDSIRGEGHLDPRDAVLGRAHVLARSARQGRRYCEIDLGAVDGVEKGMAAIVGWSLVGVVAGVDPGGGRALVQQLTDSECRTPAMLMDGDQVIGEGVISGTGKRGALSLDYIEDRQGRRVAVGQNVVTAAQPPGIPPGLVLGVVTSVSRSPTSDHWQIEVAPLHLIESRDSVVLLRRAVSQR